jgi:hypothetical protein
VLIAHTMLRISMVLVVVGLLDSVALATNGPNGLDMNGLDMNGLDMNGLDMNGLNLNGLNLNGLNLTGVTITHDVWLDRTLLQATIADTPHPTTGAWCPHSELSVGPRMPASCGRCAELVVEADSYCANVTWDDACVDEAEQQCALDAYDLAGTNGDMQGVYVYGTKSNGASVKLMIDSVQSTSVAGVYKYGVYWQKAGYTTCIKGICTYHPASWQPICPGTDRFGGSNMAIAVPGTFSSTGRYLPNDGWSFACRDKGAAAKCLDNFRYGPWASTNYEACTRMVRADYCGNGVPHTVNGTMIDVWDGDGINTNSSTAWPFEAGWDANGSTCIAHPRFIGPDPNPTTGASSIANYLYTHCRARYDQLVSTTNTCSTQSFVTTTVQVKNESQGL